MMLFAHVGLTLAGTQGFDKVIRGCKSTPAIDYRLVFVGSMLPDIIDKPLGGIILKETIGNGRIYSHTLLFLFLLLGIGMYFRIKHKRTAVLVLAWGSMFHHLLDGMWMYPETFLWPLYGINFPPGNPENWLSLWMQNLLTKPCVFIPELIGAAFLLHFIIKLNFKKGLKGFLKTGQLSTREISR